MIFSGGEPTLQRGLSAAIASVRALGFKTGLHTSGAYPHRLQAILTELDWVGLDIKAPIGDYDKLTGCPRSGDRAWESVRLVLESGVQYEVRTTIHPALLSRDSLLRMAQSLAGMGVRNYVLQLCSTRHCLDQGLQGTTAPWCLDQSLSREMERLFANFSIRSAN